ncbi:MAG: sugar phosphate isomerase/epimerase [Candidatus Latescibacteria bacterium]|jgi:sugar phosphate isomerase/epimerase|nr:sugar phosphate isomerase/epimerase [Candidatus Latescibacterota bacterium]MBT4138124.1 sugar phosphate isomerase/epimerase [Candidatus Latescibacterota bacterium]
MELAYFADEVDKEDFDEAVRLGVEAGATGIELRGGIWGKRVQQIDDDEVKRVQDVLAKYNVKILSVGSPVGKCAHDNPEELAEHQKMFERMVELAKAFDTTVIRGFAFWNPNRKSGDRTNRPGVTNYLDTLVPFLTPIVNLAAQEGVTFSLENEGACLAGSCAEALEVATALGDSPGFSFCWDVNNGISCGENAMPDGYSLIKDRMTHLHIKPNDDKELNPIRNSDLQYVDLIKQVLSDGYTGAASIEHWGSPELMLKGVRDVRALLDTL